MSRSKRLLFPYDAFARSSSLGIFESHAATVGTFAVPSLAASAYRSRAVVYDIAAAVALVIVVVLLFLLLFERGLAYCVKPPKAELGEEKFLRVLAALSDAQFFGQSRVEVLANGEKFYDAMLAAIRQAQCSINLEAYIFARGDVTQRFIDALSERARAGVKVHVVLDAIGSFTTWDSYLRPLRDAGGRVHWYQPIRWYTLKRFNNRTHRELLIVDGKIGFIGGAGIADFWLKEIDGKPRWRDTVCRVQGDLITGLQTAFAENWLEAADEILTGEHYFPTRQELRDLEPGSEEESKGFVVISAPSAGRSSRSRVLFQTLLASAKKSIHINSPYFMPDRSARRELCRAVERGVEVKIITPGEHADHLLTRRSSRRRYGDLLRGGAHIHEYQPAMIHAKILIIDNLWSVVGSTNFDNRSFGINDEVNLAAACPALARELESDFQADLSHSRRITLEEWRRRPLRERLVEWLGVILERQQ